MTPHEKKMWYGFLKMLPITVNRQKIIGDFIVDFYIHSAHLVIELDGSQHTAPEHESEDLKRDSVLASMGITVLRYTNEEIDNNFYNVCDEILSHIPNSEQFYFTEQ